MDLEALNRNVTKLMQFMARLEKGTVVGNTDNPPFDAAKLTELDERVRATDEKIEGLDLANLKDHLTALDNYKVEVVEPALKDLSDLMPALKDVGEMVTWWKANRENLEGAAALADAFDEEGKTDGATDGTSGSTGSAAGTTETPVVDATTGAGTADPGPQTGTGALSPEAGGDPLVGTDASQAGADVAAEQAVDKPAAG